MAFSTVRKVMQSSSMAIVTSICGIQWCKHVGCWCMTLYTRIKAIVIVCPAINIVSRHNVNA